MAVYIKLFTIFPEMSLRSPMARQLYSTSPSSTPLNASQAGLAAVTLLLCAFALIKCASHTRKLRRQWRACYEFFDEDYIDPVIEIQHEATNADISDYQADDVADTSMFSREQPVWQKNILMGEKCQLPDFSGVIIYDSEGNVVTSSKSRLLTWK
ncbi:hypothetical protein E1A91_A06G121600v1 [Gossypium mustelinum]|uniref:Uncharacterized protein n=5 Tax=Gossypium TaxID=3633 RepID=A0A5J5VDB0_GOSBA|nr:hypothetical protein ES319_A06G121300v1 [Gossypium barbadense]TYH13384.1 hypothetical protein ES288_A06G135800v1 [Gossypium darwinii]TYJ30295.1 hypothetical protein E1A91_A06G121600v1 [Gossypium mustelinum]